MHDDAAALLREQGDRELSVLERRIAKLERAAAELERDRARLFQRRGVRSVGDAADDADAPLTRAIA
jgi:hypothetical protein